MTDSPIALLLVEDNPGDARLVQEMLRQHQDQDQDANANAADAPHTPASARFTLTHVPRLAAALAHLQQHTPDAILLDLSLPDGHGMQTVARVHAAAPRVPIVVMSGLADEGLALAGVQQGAQDYLVKGRVEGDGLVRAVRYAIERQHAEDRLAYLAHHDALTGLPNRTLLQDRLDQAVAQARRYGHGLAVLFLDLDGFKPVNDTLGHDMGDRLLQEVATRLTGCLRESDTVARLGGDEFTLLLPEIAQAHDAVAVAQKIVEVLAAEIVLDGRRLRVTSSIGISLYPTSSETAEGLLKSADTAMYRAKKLGAGRYEFYSPDMTLHVYEQFTLEQELRAALDGAELCVHYQPVVDLATGATIGMEALVRWQHPRHGLILPARFVDLAERAGLSAALSRHVLETALHDCRGWLHGGHELGVAVNISEQVLHDARWPTTVREMLLRHEVAPERLTLETTENAIMGDPERALQALETLSRIGVRLAIDDFGTGHSSLGYLKRLPVDEVKVDASFGVRLGADAENAAIVCSIIGMAHALKLDVVAEGVEDRAAYELLNAVGCDRAQGYHMSHPLTAAELARRLDSGSPGPNAPSVAAR